MRKKIFIIYFITVVFVLLMLVINVSVSADNMNDPVEVTSISMHMDNGGSPEEITMLIGTTERLRVSILPENATNREIIWSTSNPNVATVSNGVITANGKGTATIKAVSVSGNHTASCGVLVIDENSAGTFVRESGVWGNNIKWYYCAGKRLVITGEGEMKEAGHPFQIPWISYDLLSIEIQEGITSICSNAFNGMEASKIYLPSTVTQIGRNAFYCFRAPSNFQDWYYGGTPTQWGEIAIADYNDGLTSIPDEYCYATGHIEEIESPIGSTCMSYGKTVGVHCVQCKKVIVKSTDIEYIDCTYKDGFCTMCGKASPIVRVNSVCLSVDFCRLKLNESVSVCETICPQNATNKNVFWTSSNEKIAMVDNGIVTAVGVGNATITVTTEDGGYSAKCDVTVFDTLISYSFGQSVQIGLIEPWFLKANARVYTDEYPTNIHYANLVDYGAYFIRASALADENATQESLSIEDIINNPASTKYSKSDGTARVDGSYITANYDKGLYTYELDDSVFVLFFIEDANGITYAPIRERNLKSLLEARCEDAVNFPNKLEREVYKKMLDIFDAISAYRDDYFSQN